MPDEHDVSLQEVESKTDVQAAEVEAEQELVILDAEAFKAKAKRATSAEGRAENAKPHWVKGLKCHVLVAPAVGFDFYEKLFGSDLFAKDLSAPDTNISREFLTELIVACVVKPEIDAETVGCLNVLDFAELAAACGMATQFGLGDGFESLLGVEHTEAQEGFTEGQDGSTSTPTLA